ncbi:hypothetical protein CH253_21870 [Rhodococcus sp. 06-156-3C]|uniref:hypothetical protein n=1 Tax=Nocardiaceae TaxID=85025 RepID=UPI000522F857|nr:hypothetical protein [Rhodococcus fascians]OZD13242.1 hypothetical protein CH280_15870 [Rhodococcus sp. 06-156-4C]OZD16162.1 hypothetical protein CH253_21870 [Rhodococcus sp. 06-156-3C]OZD17516.1 hypothetical protein CH248_18705 [Rhodococcus sp. 06-156-4a]OZD34711.1 hypothetical protein CH247_06525 [Rhodococcus sp. 06-156-3b]OZD36092.1 hypothetical protein CH284_13245 [Rhodococcus sp. 06-156-3]OZF67659.1 hypothetical protein CH290_06405 [Rhodococcus sp. 06-156-4]
MAVAATTLLAGCGSSDDEASSETDTSATTSSVSLPVTPVTTTLVDPGAEPRTAVTRNISGEQSVRLTTRSTVTQQIDDQAVQDFSTPNLTVPLTARASGASGDEVDLTIGVATSADQRLTDQLAAADGSGAGLTVTDGGAVTALSITPADAAQDAARAAIEQALNQAVYRSISFPEEDLGIGAVWTAQQQVISGLTLNQTTTATLRAREGDVLTIDLRIDQTPESTTLELPDDAGQLAIDNYTMSGTGTLRIDLTKPLPVWGEVTVGGSQQYSDTDGTTVLRQDISDTLEWASE